jgi:superfamily II DNA or RNA helicase
MQVLLSTRDLSSYRLFLKIKQLPSWRIQGHVAEFPDEYAELILGQKVQAHAVNWEPSPFLYDYQLDIAKLAITKRKYAVFADCGLGKTLIMLEFAQAAQQPLSVLTRGFLIVSPLMVVPQTQEECQRWYGFQPEYVKASKLQHWLDNCGGKIGITNYEGIHDDLQPGRLGGLALDESSLLKSHYGKWGTKLIEMGKGLEWKLCLTGTPAPNDRIEYANHAVFLDAFPTVNSFLATFFVNRGQTSERWVLKDHAFGAFYRALSHWCVFLTDPATYGWQDNTAGSIPPIHVHIHEVPLSSEQRRLVSQMDNQLFTTDLGGISTRAAYGQIAKGYWKKKQIATHKPKFIADLIGSWQDRESTLLWCIYNEEQSRLERELPDAATITGATPHGKRQEMIAAFKHGEIRTLITKPKILGFGLNLEVATRQVFSGLQDSYESYYQAVKRSNRIGSHKPLHVHIPVTDIEEPMVQNVLRKAHRVQHDTEEQERLFKELSWQTY